MSETRKTKPNNTINYIVFGNENELEINETGANKQDAVHNIPGIPMEIQVDSHTFDIAQNGEVIRKGKDGKRLPGTVTNKKVVDAVRKEQKEQDTIR